MSAELGPLVTHAVPKGLPQLNILMKLLSNLTIDAMVHNHPSGDPRPSRADIEMTKKVKDAAAAVGLTLHDHVIVSRGGHLSFRSEGLI